MEILSARKKMKNNSYLSELKVFKVNGKTYTHFRRHKANSRQLAFDKLQNNMGQLNEREIHIFKASYNMGYKEAWKRDNKNPSDKCLYCGKLLGFKGFCSRECHKNYFRKPDGHAERKSRKYMNGK